VDSRQTTGGTGNTPTTIADAGSGAGDVRTLGSFYGPINTTFTGLTMFRGNGSGTYYGEGPLPSNPQILWRFGSMSGMSTTEGKSIHGTHGSSRSRAEHRPRRRANGVWLHAAW